MNINLHIERLELDGICLESHHRAELKIAIESELSRLLVSNGSSSGIQSSNRFDVVSNGLISIQNTSEPASLGQQIGKAVYRGIAK